MFNHIRIFFRRLFHLNNLEEYYPEFHSMSTQPSADCNTRCDKKYPYSWGAMNDDKVCSCYHEGGKYYGAA